MSKGRTKYARVIENVIVVKRGYPPLPLRKNTVLPIHTEGKGSGFVVLLVGERGVTLQSQCVSVLSRREAADFRRQMAVI